MSAGWSPALDELESALAGFEQAAAADDFEAAAAVFDGARPALPTPLPAALEERARRLELRMAALIHDLEGRRAAVGSELAAISAGAPAAGGVTPRFFDTKA